MGGFAWVTLATNDSYSLGALVLAHSLRRAGTKHDLAVLITPGVTQVMRDKLAAVFSLVQEVNVLDSKEEANLALLARPELGITFTKLHCWRLTQYEKCVFVDADALVIRNCDELFEREELSAAPDVGWPDCFNSGVFVFTPSQQTFASITAFAAEKGSFDGGDQGLLNSYFSDWAHKDIAKHLPFIYNMCSTATYSYLPAYKQYGENARIIHFIGATKPWLQYFDTETGVVHPPSGCNHLQPLLQLWWNIFCENVHSQLSSVMAGIAGALAQLTLGEPRSSQQSALEEHMRRQGWEQGHIDYMGQDSFDNIWKKICTTLDKAPQRQPSPPKEVESEESKPSTLPEPAPVVESSPTAATETEDNVVSPIPSEDQATTIQEPTKEIQPPIPETIQTPTAEEEQQTTKLDSIEQEAKPIVEVEKPEAKVSSLPEPETLDDAPVAEKFISTFEVAAEEPLAPVKLSTILSSTPIPASEPVAEGIDVASELSELILDISSVPIQVAESVLQSEPKESASEEQGPIGEEAVSSVVAPVLESATAVSETVSEPKEREPATSNTQNITNGVEKTSPESQAPPKTEETPAPEPVADKPEPEPVAAKPEPEPVAEKPAPEPVVEKPELEPVAEKTAPEPVAEKPEPEPVAEKPAPEPVVEKPAPEPVVEKPAPEPIDKKPEPEPVADKPEPVVEKSEPEPVVDKPEPEPVVEKPAPEPVAEQVAEDVIDDVQVEEESLNGDSSKSASVTPPDSPTTECPVPVRPARTRDPKIPTTPTVTEATPPNSPPIGAGQSLEDAPKTVKKIVKKVVKKVPTEGESSEAVEGETTGKKVVKKIVKKIVKKPKEGGDADGAEASGTAEKPKKVVKIVKKIVKPSDSLEVDASVPETPPAGVPVPPKRKIKTTTTTTTKVTTTTKTPSADGGKPSESEP